MKADDLRTTSSFQAKNLPRWISSQQGPHFAENAPHPDVLCRSCDDRKTGTLLPGLAPACLVAFKGRQQPALAVHAKHHLRVVVTDEDDAVGRRTRLANPLAQDD